jgi:EpsI family protein
MGGSRAVANLGTFLRGPAVAALSVLLVAQAGAYYLLPKAELAPPAPPLSGFPTTLDAWHATVDVKLEDEVLKVLRADDTMSRMYQRPDSPFAVSLFMAYFRSQKSGAAPHSPKNCLPGSGWAPLSSGTIAIDVPGQPEPVEVNRFIVGKGTERTLVLYWYQTAHRVVASEYMAKVWLVLDSLRYRRSDTAIVRVVVPVP